MAGDLNFVRNRVSARRELTVHCNYLLSHLKQIDEIRLKIIFVVICTTVGINALGGTPI